MGKGAPKLQPWFKKDGKNQKKRQQSHWQPSQQGRAGSHHTAANEISSTSKTRRRHRTMVLCSRHFLTRRMRSGHCNQSDSTAKQDKPHVDSTTDGAGVGFPWPGQASPVYLSNGVVPVLLLTLLCEQKGAGSYSGESPPKQPQTIQCLLVLRTVRGR